MAIWNVMIPGKPGETDAHRAEHAVLVRERPFVLAFLFPAVALLRFRLWLAFVGYLIVAGIIAVLDAAIDPPVVAEVAAGLALNLLVCLELSTLRLHKLRRLGYREAGVVSAPSRDEAVRRFFADFTFESLPEVVPPRPMPSRYTAPGPVIGSFPEPRVP